MENTTENGVDLSDSTVISETAEFDESAVMSSLEVHSTPNVGQDDKTTNISNTNETGSTEDSGIQVTPVSYTHLLLQTVMLVASNVRSD